MKCHYCMKEKVEKHHPSIEVHYKGMTKEVYVCPDCASKNSIGDLLVSVTLIWMKMNVDNTLLGAADSKEA